MNYESYKNTYRCCRYCLNWDKKNAKNSKYGTIATCMKKEDVKTTADAGYNCMAFKPEQGFSAKEMGVNE
jgi:hypothetical protein